MRFLSIITLLVALGVMLGTIPEIGNAQRSDKPMSSEGSFPGGNRTLNSVIGENDQRLQRLCCGARPAALTFPLAPSSYRVGEEGGTRGAGTKE